MSDGEIGLGDEEVTRLSLTHSLQPQQCLQSRTTLYSKSGKLRIVPSDIPHQGSSASVCVHDGVTEDLGDF